ncbi:MAG TPA: cupin domain-containing protein [Vitreimonas sp.]|uniref:cupin domain-containing protein n=1 Tax=Vitreimonas sp. TaxID=3069702 RepID=UPI002D2D43D9|nr:cupin domain-containing protein [Vitreimonas sp.]HYD88894.1 cupin domain-containing protein [Vitreimonas sp.]
MSDFAAAMRRVITGDTANGNSVVIVDGPPSGEIGEPNLGGLFEIWHEALGEPLDPKEVRDRGETRPGLAPADGHVKVRWFVIAPTPEGAPPQMLKDIARQRFADFDAADYLTDQDRHPAMHQTDSLDIICLISGDASLILDDSETRLKPGQIVIQRGTSHAWTAHGGPALFLAVLIDRKMK